ncbi:hypothetical protein Tco_0381508 [Tanacetum coccineum]
MAQQIIPAAQLVPKYQSIRRCNSYVVLQTILCSPECKILGHILFDHPLSYALIATADVLVVYLQQFWKTVSKMPKTKDTIKFKNIIQYPRFTKLIIADLMKKYQSIPPSLEEDFHSIKDDIPLVSVYTTGNVIVRGMLIPNAFLTKEIRTTNDYKETTPRAHMTHTLTTASPQGKKRKQKSYADKFAASMVHNDVDDFGNMIEPKSHKEHPKVVDDDDENEEEKKYDTKDDKMGRIDDTVSPSTTTTSKDPQMERRISSKYSHLPGVLRRMYRRQGYMIKDMERKCVITDEFWKVHGKVDQVLHEIIPQIAKRATNDLIEDNLKRVMADTVIQERDAFQSEVPALISKEFDAHAPKIIEDLFKHYVQTNVIQVHPTTSTSIDTTSSADLQQQLYLKMKSNL